MSVALNLKMNNSKERIEIVRKGKRKVVARHYDENNDLVTKTTACCHKDDNFDFITGSTLALARMIFKESK